MVKSIYFTQISYSDFTQFKGRPILIFKELQNDYLYMPITSNLQRKGAVLTNDDMQSGEMRKKSVVIVPKISAIDKKNIIESRLIGTIKESKFNQIQSVFCKEIGCKDE